MTLAGPRRSWSGDGHEYLQELVRSIEPFGAYVGAVDRGRVPALVRAHDVMVVPSLSEEPFGLVVLEAMASGLAVIASNRGGLPEACGGAATLVDPDDLDALTCAVAELAEPRRLLAAKRASVARASSRTWEKVADELFEHLSVEP